MKKLILILALFSFASANAQVFQSQSIYGVQYKRLKIDSTLHIPTFCGVPTLSGSVIGNQGALAIDSCNKKLYFYDPEDSTWNIVASLAGVDTLYTSSSTTTDTIIGEKNGSRFVVSIIDSKQGVIDGIQVSYVSGLTYHVTSGVAKIGVNRWNITGADVTLATADPTNDRIDIIAIDSTGPIVITGTPSANPASPQVNGDQIELIEVLVKAGATTPSGVSTSLIYDEHIEWTFTSTLTADADNTVAPFHLTKDVYASAGSSGNYFQLANSTTLNSTDYTNLTFHIKMNGTLNSRSNISVQFFNGSVNVSNGVILGSTYGFSKSVTSYQTITVPITAFNFSSSTFDRVRFIYTGTSFQTFYVDYIQLQAGVPTGGGGSGITAITATSPIISSGGSAPNISLDTTKVHTSAWNDATYSKKTDSTIVYTARPIYSDADTIKFKSDSLTDVLKYASVFTNMLDDSSLVPKHYVDSLLALKLNASKLNGGTTGQILVKNSNTDQDYSWSTAAGSTNANIGSGYRIAVPLTNNIKTLYGVGPIVIDSTTNLNALTFKFDSTNNHSIYYYNTIYGSLSQQNTNTSNIASNTTTIGNKADKSTTITINGVSHDLSTNQSWTLATGATWGSITGTLSSQTDLQTALNAKEESLGNPSTDGYVLSSTAAGVRSWVPMSGGISGSQAPYTVYGNHTSVTAAPTFDKLPIQSLNVTGTPNSGTFLRGDGSWTVGNLSPFLYNSNNIYFNTGFVGLNTTTPIAQFSIRNDTITAAPDSTTGIVLQNLNSGSGSYYSPSVYFQATAIQTTGSIEKYSAFRMYSRSTTGSTSTNGYFFIDSKADYNSSTGTRTWNNWLTIHNSGAALDATVQGTFTINGTTNLNSTTNVSGTLGAWNINSGTFSASLSYKSTAAWSSGQHGASIFAFSYAGTVNGTGLSSPDIFRIVYINPTITSTFNTDLRAWENSHGNVLFGTTDGSVSIGPTTTIPSGRIFQVVSTTLASSPFPPMTTTQRLALTPNENDGVYDTSLHKVFVYDGTTWNALW